jgi:hypothetical protein
LTELLEVGDKIAYLEYPGVFEVLRVDTKTHIVQFDHKYQGHNNKGEAVEVFDCFIQYFPNDAMFNTRFKLVEKAKKTVESSD